MKTFIWNLAICMITLTSTFGADTPEPNGPRLRDIVEEHYPDGTVYIGGTTGWEKLPKGDGTLLDREFSYVCPENDFKQHAIHPSPGIWNWSTADQWIQHCLDNGQVLRIHGPISPQCSRWTKEDSRTAEELSKNLDEFMTALSKRYNGYPHVKWMDVVNETVLPSGAWFGPKDGVGEWENPWPKIGFDETHPLRPPLYIKQAFEIANRYAPDIEQIINQHGGMEEKMWDKVKATVRYLRENNLRVDGIGWQAHINVGWEKKSLNIRRLKELIKWAHGNNLSFHVTEMNVWLDPSNPDYEAQADTFAAVLKALLENRQTGQVTWNTWNLSDATAWEENRDKKGCIFFDDMSPKPAYYAIRKTLLEEAN
ncbi:MAG: endo-1,4-beta-xylanase [Verrucomicrobia bacterium]|nr:endo-1,4-beta-xylanase [Verrucomicrobiota bacterium]